MSELPILGKMSKGVLEFTPEGLILFVQNRYDRALSLMMILDESGLAESSKIALLTRLLTHDTSMRIEEMAPGLREVLEVISQISKVDNLGMHPDSVGIGSKVRLSKGDNLREVLPYLQPVLPDTHCIVCTIHHHDDEYVIGFIYSLPDVGIKYSTTHLDL
jgi:hypothetical protein